MSEWIHTVRGDVRQGTSLVSTLLDSFTSFCAARHMDIGHLAPNECTALLRETAVNIWLLEADEPDF